MTIPGIPALEAFARLYGCVRYFHPGDEAAALDWDRFAVLGAGRLGGVMGSAGAAPS